MRIPRVKGGAAGMALKRAALGYYLDNGRISEKLRRKGLKPETKYRPDGEGEGGHGKR
jgi:hypothetical protein